MSAVDSFALDRLVLSAARELRAERTRMRTREGAADGAVTLSRRISSKAALAELGEQRDSLLARGLAPWVRLLTVARVTAGDRALVAQRRFGDETSLQELSLSLFAQHANVEAIQRSLCDAAVAPRDALHRHLDRVKEATRLLGGDDVAEAAEGQALAEEVLRVTEPAFVSEGARSWSSAFQRALATDAGEGWPVHISPRWLAALFDRGELLRGVDLEVGPLPAPLGASSFARALASLGEALAFADLPPGTPFCLARGPRDPLLSRRAALLGSLVLEPKFFQRKLGLGGPRAREQAGKVARAAVVWARTAALRVLAYPLLFQEAGGRAFEELTDRVLGKSIPGVLLGVLPKLDEGDRGALVGLADAALERQQLRERFDDDWFDNPSAHEALRHEHQLPIVDRPRLLKEDSGPELRTTLRAAAVIQRLREAIDE